MNFALSEEQQLLQQMANEFVKRESSMQRIRQLREDEAGFSPELWAKMGELGWLGVTIPEECGGLGQGMVDLVVVMEELGRGLLPEPMLSTVLLGASAIQLGGSPTQQQRWLPPVVEGKTTLSLAYLEKQSRYDPFDVVTHAKKQGDGWLLRGEKVFVPDALAAERIVVSARTQGSRRDPEGLALFLVDPQGEGVELREIPCMDSRKRYVLVLNDTPVAEQERLSGTAPADRALEGALDRATVGLCAEMLGGMNGAFEMTLDYLKTREQFGVKIGSFQALKHRCADEYVQTELARSAVYYAAMCLDENLPEAAAAVSTAKARCNDAFHLIADESIQMHGGIGMTDEHDIGLYFMRARVAEVTLGDTTFHLDRYARLKEY